MKKRIISAAVLIPIVVFASLASEISRVGLFWAAGVICLYEYIHAVQERKSVSMMGPVLYFYLAAKAALAFLAATPLLHTLCLAAAVILSMLCAVRFGSIGAKGAAATLVGLLYPGFLLGLVLRICVSELWLPALGIACISTWVCDSCALFGGSLWGEHKLAPAVSPNKSVEGCLCGAGSAVLSGIALGCVRPFSEWSVSVCVLTALISSSLGQVGDLAESLVKRELGIKDFSDLIPGHGGMLDRADSLLFSVPTAWLCLRLAERSL